MPNQKLVNSKHYFIRVNEYRDIYTKVTYDMARLYWDKYSDLEFYPHPGQNIHPQQILILLTPCRVHMPTPTNIVLYDYKATVQYR